MGKRTISSVQEAELPVTKKTRINKSSQLVATLEKTKVSPRPISFFGKATKRGLVSSSEEEKTSSKRQCIRSDGKDVETTKKTPAMKKKPTEEGLGMSQLFEKLFAPLREKEPLPTTSQLFVLRPKPKTYDNSKFDITTAVYGPRPKTQKSAAKKPQITIFEDDTATKAANPTPEEIENDLEYRDYGTEDDIPSNINYIRRGTKTVMQNYGWIYANYVTNWLLSGAVCVDAKTPHTGRGFVERIIDWENRLDDLRAQGICRPTSKLRGSARGKYEYFPWWHQDLEEEWFKVEDVEELAEIISDFDITVRRYKLVEAMDKAGIMGDRKSRDSIIMMIAAYCRTGGAGMDVGSPEVGDYLEDGRRNPAYFERLMKAWSKIFELYVGEGIFESCWNEATESHYSHQMFASWVSRVRRKMKSFDVNDFIRWGVMEKVWGDSYPPLEQFRLFGEECKRGPIVDLWAEEMAQLGLDELSNE